VDILQIALIFLIVLLSVFLSVLGIQVFFILKDLRKSLDKLDRVLESTEDIAENLEKPARVVSEVTQVLEGGVKVVKALGERSGRPAKRLFKRR
jgi:hypothetical protein